MKQKVKCGQKYYLVLHKRDWTYKPAVIVPVKALSRKKYSDWVVVEQNIDGHKHKLTVHFDWLAPHKIECAKNLLHNMKMWEKRWSANCWRHRLNYKTAKSEVPKALAELSKKKQSEIFRQINKTYPQLLKTKNTFMVSKIKMTQWDEIAWAIIASKYPLKEVWV